MPSPACVATEEVALSTREVCVALSTTEEVASVCVDASDVDVLGLKRCQKCTTKGQKRTDHNR